MEDWPYFTRAEFACPLTDGCAMREDFMARLVALREEFGRPMVVTSGYRSPEHNEQIGGAQNSAHMDGRAVDVLMAGEHAFQLVKRALEHGFTGIGLKQHGPFEKRFVHLDDAAHEGRPRVWTYS